MSRLSGPAVALAICFAVSLLVVLIDVSQRADLGDAGFGGHLGAAILMYAGAAVLASLVTVALVALYGALSRRRPTLGLVVVAVLSGVLAGAAVTPTVLFTFSSDKLATTAVGRVGPILAIGATSTAAALAAAVVTVACRAAQRGRLVGPLLVTFGFSLTAAGATYVDLTYYVALYARLHAVLEAVSALALAAALAPLFAIALSRMPTPTTLTALGVAAAGAVLGLTALAVPPARLWASSTLKHTWRQPVFAGRMLARAQFVESYLKNPGAWTDETLTGVGLLRKRYDLATTTRAPDWDAPLAEPEALRERPEASREGQQFNIIVYYVDTLRADVAFDPKTMPAVSKFAKASLAFERAYATGSDTLHSLPGLISGSYDLFEPHENDFLKVARRAGFKTSLISARSATEFLGKLLPQFAFDEEISIDDYVKGNRKVWGYGADQPTAARIVDRTLDWVGEHRNRRFLTWMFNFDIHAWRELDEAYVNDAAKTYGIEDDDEKLAWRYRVIARALDAEFARLLRGLDDLGVADDTIVLFVSDHGEALGRDGFWVHSVFLWESLVRVPLILRVPGVAPHRVEERVSLVDVAPTLVRFMVPGADMRGYHGQDLLGYLQPEPPPRRLPLMLAGTSKEKLVRLGIIDPATDRKLVLPLEAAVPELYDLRASDPDDRDISSGEPEEALRLLSNLVRAPLFPRPESHKPGAEVDEVALH